MIDMCDMDEGLGPLVDSEEDPARLWAEIHTLRAAVAGPKGYATWQEAATAERMLRVCKEQQLAALQAQIDELMFEYCPEKMTHE